MSKFNLEAPFSDFKGKICKHTKIIYKRLGNTNYTSQICHPRTEPFSNDELARQSLFAQASAATKTVLADSTQKATATAEFKAQKKYSTLRGYVFAREYAKLIPASPSEP